MTESASTDSGFDLLDTPLRAVAHAAYDAMVLIDERQFIVALNPSAQRMFRCEQGDVLGQPFDRLIPQARRLAHESHVQRFNESGEAERAMGKRTPISGLRCDGQEFPAEGTVSRIEANVDGEKRQFYVALLRDLSHEKDLRRELFQMKQRVRTILDVAPTAMWICEGDRIAFANPAAIELFEPAATDGLVGRSIYALLQTDAHEGLRQQVANALTGQAPVGVVQTQIVQHNGTVREVEIASAALPDHGRTVVQMVVADITRRQQEALGLKRSRQELRQLSARIVEAREGERRRIARELHDELGQRLTALKMELSALGPAAHRRAEDGRIAAMLTMIDETVASVRRISTDLRPLMLDDLGLNAAIEWLAHDAAQRMGLEITVNLGPENPPANDRTATALYRVVQEALTNVARHANATRVHIELQRQGDQTLTLSVQDNGVGFPDPSRRREGAYGLLGIRERAYMLGGTLHIDSPPSGGGRITVHLPLHPLGDSDMPLEPVP